MTIGVCLHSHGFPPLALIGIKPTLMGIATGHSEVKFLAISVQRGSQSICVS